MSYKFRVHYDSRSITEEVIYSNSGCDDPQVWHYSYLVANNLCYQFGTSTDLLAQWSLNWCVSDNQGPLNALTRVNLTALCAVQKCCAVDSQTGQELSCSTDLSACLANYPGY